jgi:hypothetical protein
MLAGLLLIAALSFGCVGGPPFRAVPDFEQRFAGIETITLVPPKVAVYRLTAGGVEEEVQDWTDSAHRQLVAAVERRVREIEHLRFVPYQGAAVTWEEAARADKNLPATAERTPLDESWKLFEAVVSAIHQHTYDPSQAFPHKQDNFDYTLGSEAAAVVEETKVDAFLLVVATDHVATGGRQALIALGVLAGAVTGVYAGPGGSPATALVALVEARSGDILWFNAVSSETADLRKPESDEELVDLVMKGLDED